MLGTQILYPVCVAIIPRLLGAYFNNKEKKLQALLNGRNRQKSWKRAWKERLQYPVQELRALRHLVSLRKGNQPAGRTLLSVIVVSHPGTHSWNSFRPCGLEEILSVWAKYSTEVSRKHLNLIVFVLSDAEFDEFVVVGLDGQRRSIFHCHASWGQLEVGRG